MVEIISKGTKMLNQKELFNNAMGRLLRVYQNNPAQIEAVRNAAKVASALMEGNTGLNVSLKNREATTYGNQKLSGQYGNAPGQTSLQSPKPNARALAGAMTLVRKWAKSDPVGCQKWVNDTLSKDIENTASAKFSNLSDDWKKAFNDEVSGEADKQREKLSAELAANKEKEDRKAGEKLYKQKEKEFWDNQKAMEKADKHQAHVDAIKKMDDEDAEYEKKRADIQKNGGDPEIYNDTKKRGLFNKLGRGIKRMWHSLHEAAEQAIKDGDMAKLESIKAKMVEMRTMFEAAGIDFEKAIMD